MILISQKPNRAQIANSNITCKLIFHWPAGVWLTSHAQVDVTLGQSLIFSHSLFNKHRINVGIIEFMIRRDKKKIVGSFNCPASGPNPKISVGPGPCPVRECYPLIVGWPATLKLNFNNTLQSMNFYCGICSSRTPELSSHMAHASAKLPFIF